jgi:hypothetical protein
MKSELNEYKIKLLTKDEIVDRLKQMKVGEEYNDVLVLPFKWLSFFVPNDEYDPDNFSQEIEDSEEKIDIFKNICEEIHKPEFDFVWNNTLGRLPENSQRWQNNHSKICSIKIEILLVQSVVHEDGTRDYYSDEIVNKIMNINEKYGGIINFC